MRAAWSVGEWPLSIVLLIRRWPIYGRVFILNSADLGFVHKISLLSTQSPSAYHTDVTLQTEKNALTRQLLDGLRAFLASRPFLVHARAAHTVRLDDKHILPAKPHTDAGRLL